METLEKTKDKPILVEIAGKLVEAQQELDELVIQFALGKAEAKDKFEEIKSDFRTRMNEWKASSLSGKLASVTLELRNRFEDLEAKLTSGGKITTREAFEEQKSKIEESLEKLRTEIQTRLADAIDVAYFEHELEKFKLKLEILRLRFVLKNFEVKEAFEDGMKSARKKITQTVNSVREKLNPEKSDYDDFKKEIKEVYDHLKKAVKAL